jgi:septal ring factor EnvC (AmiA/AmiB activator)
LKRTEQERDTALEQQQEGWRESRLMSQKIDSLMQLLVAKENDELRELRRAKDRSKGLEAELAAAKTRVAEIEARVEGLVRSEAKATQSVEDAKRQAQDYETKLQKIEREIEPLRRLDDAQKTRDREFEQIRSQLQLQERQEVSLR